MRWLYTLIGLALIVINMTYALQMLSTGGFDEGGLYRAGVSLCCGCVLVIFCYPPSEKR